MRILTYEYAVQVDTYVHFRVVNPTTFDDSIGRAYFDKMVAEVKRLGFQYTVTERHDVVVDKSPEVESA